ncbi:MAG: hypothetical protein RJA63_2565 [Pseudomonadota bacterium]|jgi:hypothetical protein
MMPTDHTPRCKPFALDAKGPLFALGCFERRVTIYSQQVRALELARAMVEDSGMRLQGRVAVIGGGIGGATLAAALAVAAPQLHVVLFEAEDRLMHLQQGGRDRFVHPHIFDWPSPRADRDDAGLPLMNWSAGPASEVVAELAVQFDAIAKPQVAVRYRTRVTGLVEIGRSFRVAVAGAPESDIYDAVALCIGFGLEKNVKLKLCSSYWSPSLLPAPLLTGQDRPEVFVSGNGDGGLADFALAAFNAEAHGDILRLIANHPDVAPLVDTLLKLDDNAWADPAFDLYSSYLNTIKPLLKEALLLDVHDRLRNVSLRLHTQESQLFRRDTAVLNRLVAFIALVADEYFEGGRLRADCSRLASDLGADGSIQLQDDDRFTPNMRLLRFGPDRDAVWTPFKQFKAGPAVDGGSQRPATPVLSSDLRDWYLTRLGGRAPATPPTPGTGNAPALRDPSFQMNVVHGSVGAGASVTQTYVGTAAPPTSKS